jgi:arylsulfatase A-like enzyme
MRSFTVLLALACFASVETRAQGDLAAPRETPASPKNVLIIVADDLGWADVGYHNPEMRTPRLDALSARGLRFDRHYVTPQCTPTRVALLTGRHPSRFGVHATVANDARALPPGTPTLASVLANAGWHTGQVGKWHLGSDFPSGPLHHGFAYAYGSLTGAIGMYDHGTLKDGRRVDTWHRNHVRLDEEGHATDLTADDAIRFVQRASPSQPWFLYVAFNAPHAPLVEREERWFTQNAHIADPHRRLFAAAVSHLDDAIGRIVDALERSGQADRTLILFLSDNGGLRRHPGDRYPAPDPALPEGFSQNTPLRGWKTQVYEGGIRVPAFLVAPGRIAPGSSRALLHVVDWLPTLTRLAGAQPGTPVPPTDGIDVSTALLTGTDLPERPLYWRWQPSADRMRTALRLGPWKALQPDTGAPWELYDLDADPAETSDLAGNRPDILATLKAAWERERRLDADPP